MGLGSTACYGSFRHRHRRLRWLACAPRRGGRLEASRNGGGLCGAMGRNAPPVQVLACRRRHRPSFPVPGAGIKQSAQSLGVWGVRVGGTVLGAGLPRSGRRGETLARSSVPSPVVNVVLPELRHDHSPRPSVRLIAGGYVACATGAPLRSWAGALSCWQLDDWDQLTVRQSRFALRIGPRRAPIGRAASRFDPLVAPRLGD